MRRQSGYGGGGVENANASAGAGKLHRGGQPGKAAADDENIVIHGGSL